MSNDQNRIGLILALLIKENQVLLQNRLIERKIKATPKCLTLIDYV